ncbi:hypothetical protein Mpet_1706 [Methanolacinia petrolearia DSM 11571]|uniref:Uncharacterized protein n=1 Tax=Methanolacinia petrolearia (strain DSM 11571 / OCM 486 / SEBR 4847) TaxID=679926 RepID=E1RHS1_METP4|nr:hypothetical protein Mpet_1706 [Methanolacinia petrolearia DSM 11571]
MLAHPNGDYRDEGEGSREGEIIPLPVFQNFERA